MFAIKNIATREKGMPDAFKTLIKNIFEMGRSAEISDFENEDREDLGLPELKEADVQGIKKVFKETKISELIDEGAE